MASTLEISCAGCGSFYRLVVREADVSALFLCIQCGEHNLYHVGSTVQLDGKIMNHGTERERRRHVRRRMEDAVLELLANIRDRMDSVVNINVDVEFAERIDPPELKLHRPRGKAAADDSKRDTDTKPPDSASAGRRDAEPEAAADRPISAADVRTLRKLLDSPNVWRHLDLS